MQQGDHGTVNVVFDMDGVLTDTESMWDEVRRGLAERAGVPWPDDATTAMMGMSTPEWSAYLSTEVGIGLSPAEAADATIDAMAERYRQGVPVMTGAVDAVRRMSEGRTLALASSSPRRLIDTVLAELGITDLFAATVSTEEVDAGKPAPDGYLRACELAGIDPARGVAVEDSSNGIRSAHAAGLAVVVVPTAFHPPSPDAAALAAATIDTLDELTPDLVEGLRGA